MSIAEKSATTLIEESHRMRAQIETNISRINMLREMATELEAQNRSLGIDLELRDQILQIRMKEIK